MAHLSIKLSYLLTMPNSCFELYNTVVCAPELSFVSAKLSYLILKRRYKYI